MTEKQVTLAIAACQLKGRTVQKNDAGNGVRVWPQGYNSGPVEFTALGDLSRWLKANPAMPVSMMKG